MGFPSTGSYKKGFRKMDAKPPLPMEGQATSGFKVYAQKPCNYEHSAETLTGGRVSVIEGAIRKWFSDIHTYVVDEEHAEDVFQDPERIFNFDESNFLLEGMSWDQ